MGKLLKKALEPANMNLAWKKLRRDKADWLPGITREGFERDFVLHFTSLQRELAEGRYRPTLIRQFPIAKGDGGKRVISAFYLRDKLAQRMILSVLEPLGEAIFHADSFGYRPGRNIGMALQKTDSYVRCGGYWLVDADIRKFFETIPHALLEKLVTRFLPDRQIRKLVAMWLDAGSPRTGWLRARRGLPQGAILSPLLCNLYLTELDQALAEKNLPFVRYADDFLVFTPARQAAVEAREYVVKVLKTLQLELHPQKTRIARAGPSVTFLGEKLKAYQPSK